MKNEFQLFAQDKGISSNTLNEYGKFMMGQISPTITEERQLNVAQMDIFSRLMMDRTIFLGTEINADVANIVNAQLLFLDATDNKKDISLYINSPGGVVYDGLSIYDTMQFINSDVQTTCTGMAASMASVLLCAGEAGKRYALPHSRVMIHQPLGGVKGQASEIEISYKEIIKLRDELYDILAEHTGQDVHQIMIDCDRDHYMTAHEAKQYGMIDNILTRKK